MRYQLGLRAKLNFVLVPLVVGTMAIFVALDYRHEVRAITAAHAAHAGTPIEDTSPKAAAASPGAVGRRALLIHTIHAVVTVVLLVAAVNVALSRLVLGPIGRIRQLMQQMERGHWRTTAALAAPDEVGELVANFHRLGLTIDALVCHVLHAERLATLALVAKKLERDIDPQVERLGAAAAALQRGQDPATAELAEAIASAAAAILQSTRRLDRLFGLTAPGEGRHRRANPLVLPATGGVRSTK